MEKEPITVEGLKKLKEELIEEIASPASNSYLGIFYLNDVFTSYYAGGVTSGQLSDEIEQTSLTHQLHSIDVPTLLLWGKYDFVVPQRLGYSAFENLGTKDKKLIIFEKSGHSLMDCEPELFTQSVIDFIEKWR